MAMAKRGKSSSGSGSARKAGARVTTRKITRGPHKGKKIKVVRYKDGNFYPLKRWSD